MIDIRNDIEKEWKRLFGENSRTDDKSINGKLISLIAYALSPLWMLAEKVYNSGFVHKADGNTLDNIVQNRLMSRRQAEKAKGIIKIIGDESTIIEAGFIVANRVEYITTQDVEIGSSGEVLAPIEAVEGGSRGNTPANTITEIVTPLVGVDEVTNIEATSGGRDKETDAELRERYDRSFAFGGSATTASIEANLLGLAGVRDARVHENTTMNELDGMPPKSIAPFVFGGEDEDIARTIYELKSAGIQSYGTTEITITDENDEEHTIGFTRNDVVDIYVHVELETNDDFPIDGYKQVRTKVIEYIGGQDEDAVEYNGLGLAQDVIYVKVIGAIQQIEGITDIPVLYIDTKTPAENIGNINITRDEVALTDCEKVTIQ